MLRHAASKSPFRSGAGQGQGLGNTSGSGGGSDRNAVSSASIALSSLVNAGVISSSSVSSNFSLVTASSNTSVGTSAGGAAGGSGAAAGASSFILLGGGSHEHTAPNTLLSLGMHSAAATGNVGLIKFAFDHGQSVASVLNGIVPLHAASSGGSEAAVRLLLAYGADPNAPRIKVKPSQSAGSGSGGGVGGGGGGSALAFSGSGIAGSSASGATTGAGLGTEGSTPLHFAAANGHEGVLRILLDSGAQPDVTDREGNTPEALALGNHHDDCVLLLRSAAAGLSNSNTNTNITASSRQHLPPALTKPASLSGLNGSGGWSGRSRGDSGASSSGGGGAGIGGGNNVAGNPSSSMSLRTQRSFDQLSSAAAGVKQSLFNRKASNSNSNMHGHPNATTSSAAAASKMFKTSSHPNLKSSATASGSTTQPSSANGIPPVPCVKYRAHAPAPDPALVAGAAAAAGCGSGVGSGSGPMRSVSPALSSPSDPADMGFATFKTTPAATAVSVGMLGPGSGFGAAGSASGTGYSSTPGPGSSIQRRPSLPSIFERADHPGQALRSALNLAAAASSSSSSCSASSYSSAAASSTTQMHPSHSMSSGGGSSHGNQGSVFASGGASSRGVDLIEMLSSDSAGPGAGSSSGGMGSAGVRMANGSAAGGKDADSDTPGQSLQRPAGKRSIGQLIRKATGTSTTSSATELLPSRVPPQLAHRLFHAEQQLKNTKAFSAPYSQTAFHIPKVPNVYMPPVALAAIEMCTPPFDASTPLPPLPSPSSAIQDAPASARLAAPPSSSASGLYNQQSITSTIAARPRQGSVSTASPSQGVSHERSLSTIEIGAILRRRALSSASADRKPFLLNSQQQQQQQYGALPSSEIAEADPKLTQRGIRAASKSPSNPGSPLLHSAGLPRVMRKDSASSMSSASVSSALAPLPAHTSTAAGGNGCSTFAHDPAYAHGSPHFSPRTRALPFFSDDTRSIGSGGVRQARSNSAAGSSASTSMSNKASNASLRSMNAAGSASAAEHAQAIMRNVEENGSTTLVKDGQKISLAEQLAAYGEALARERMQQQQQQQQQQQLKASDKALQRALTAQQPGLLPSVSEDRAQNNISAMRSIAPGSTGTFGSQGGSGGRASASRPRAWSNEESLMRQGQSLPFLPRSTSAAEAVNRSARSPKDGLKELFIDPSSRLSAERRYPPFELSLVSTYRQGGIPHAKTSPVLPTRRTVTDYRKVTDTAFFDGPMVTALHRPVNSTPVFSRASDDTPRRAGASGSMGNDTVAPMHNSDMLSQRTAPKVDSPARSTHRYSDSLPPDMDSLSNERGGRTSRRPSSRDEFMRSLQSNSSSGASVASSGAYPDGGKNGLGLGFGPMYSRDDLVYGGYAINSTASPMTTSTSLSSTAAGPFSSFISAVEASLPDHSQGNNSSNSIGAKTKRKFVRTLFGKKEQQQQ
ncbi:hypothetical protein K437DRAFT_133891 [Tilletiaria anomala UBC 951]|uniref:Uncharacterized protein n=1 Tax=Tilletiaria anomala (strain ATCC 24038 / CBS 436.72 / UBC 951) TaxID=1037660 RepID=A0A066WGP7_TILAU|nr:uncharacterized protein K437DRAFT_133891 [Tilletiaria anomala UBC 951]KDN52971.1 hypothetical protein K437DRAFT_133891 [Tilletiaria anomala UBC 951]